MCHTNIIYRSTLCVHPASRATFCYQMTGRHTASPSNSTTAARRRSIAMAAVAAVAGDVFKCAKESWNGSVISPHGWDVWNCEEDVQCTIGWPKKGLEMLKKGYFAGRPPAKRLQWCCASTFCHVVTACYAHLRSAQKQQYFSCPNEFTCEQEVERFG